MLRYPNHHPRRKPVRSQRLRKVPARRAPRPRCISSPVSRPASCSSASDQPEARPPRTPCSKGPRLPSSSAIRCPRASPGVRTEVSGIQARSASIQRPRPPRRRLKHHKRSPTRPRPPPPTAQAWATVAIRPVALTMAETLPVGGAMAAVPLTVPRGKAVVVVAVPVERPLPPWSTPKPRVVRETVSAKVTSTRKGRGTTAQAPARGIRSTTTGTCPNRALPADREVLAPISALTGTCTAREGPSIPLRLPPHRCRLPPHRHHLPAPAAAPGRAKKTTAMGTAKSTLRASSRSRGALPPLWG